LSERLEWELVYHENSFVIEAAIERGVEPPSFLKPEPLLLPGDQFYLDAFWDLSTCRQMGMGLGPIPWKDILEYAQYKELDCDLVDMFFLTIRAMDRVYLDWSDKRADKNKKK